MTIDMQELKKSAIILKAIFAEMVEIRQRNSAYQDPKALEYPVYDLMGDHDYECEPHHLFVKVFERYGWDLNKMFMIAANPTVSLESLKDKRECDPNAYGENGYDRDEYPKWIIPQQQIELSVKLAVEKIEKLANEL